jgi:hypothetical protein
VASFDKALTTFAPMQKNIEQLMTGMENISQFWLEIELSLRDLEDRVKELQDDTVDRISVQGLNRDWAGVAKEYQTYYSYVCIIHL